MNNNITRNRKIFFTSIFLLFSFIALGIYLLIESSNEDKYIENYFQNTKQEFNKLIYNNDDIKTILGYKLYFYYYNNMNDHFKFNQEDYDRYDLDIEYKNENGSYVIDLYSRFNCNRETDNTLITYEDNICTYNLYYNLNIKNGIKETLYTKWNTLISSEIELLNQKYYINYEIHDNNEIEKLGFNVLNVVKKAMKEELYEEHLEETLKEHRELLKYFK